MSIFKKSFEFSNNLLISERQKNLKNTKAIRRLKMCNYILNRLIAFILALIFYFCTMGIGAAADEINPFRLFK